MENNKKSPQVAGTTSEDKDNTLNQSLSKNDLERIGKNINSALRLATPLKGMRSVEQTDYMVTKLEGFIITKVETFDENTSPEEVVALAELVKAVNQVPRTMKALD